MPNYAQRLARRTRNTFKPAQRFFQKAAADAPGIFKKIDSGAKQFFTKDLPTAGRVIGRGLEQVGGTLSKAASGSLGMALSIAQPELAPFILGTAAAGQGLRQVGGVAKQASLVGKGLSSDTTLAQQQILERVKPIVSDAKQITFQ